MTSGSLPIVFGQALMVLIPMVLSLTVHEYAHGRVARALGDDTAERAGRLTLNPLAHADPVGTLLLPLAILMVNGAANPAAAAASLPLLGWARPTPVNAGRFNRRVTVRVGTMLVAAAGPLSNIALALGCAVAMAAEARGLLGGGSAPAVHQLLISMLTMNVALCVFNLLPLPPLDGAAVVSGLLSPARALAFERFGQQYGTYILWGIILFARGLIVVPVVFVARALLALVGAG